MLIPASSPQLCSSPNLGYKKFNTSYGKEELDQQIFLYQGMMATSLSLGRLCLRPLKTKLPYLSKQRLIHQKFHPVFFRRPPRRNGLLLAGAIYLTPAAFIQLSQEDNNNTEQTTEGRLLAASRAEIQEEVSSDTTGLQWLRLTTFASLDLYLWEPAQIGFRFLHLVLIFVPVIFTSPILWCGSDAKHWWFRFLVGGMEKAGPAFIKVNNHAL